MTEKVEMPAEETETIINYSKVLIGEWAEVYTTDKIIMKRYEKFMQKYPDRCRLLKEDKYSMTFFVHPKSASIYPRAIRQLSDEEQELRRQRFLNAIG